MTVEEMDAHMAYMEAHHKRLYEDMVAECTEQLATEKNPYTREFLLKHLEELHEIWNRRH
jgi:hypothetical protein